MHALCEREVGRCEFLGFLYKQISNQISLPCSAQMLTILTLDQCQLHYTLSTQVVGKGEKWGDGCSKEQGDWGRDTQKVNAPFS